MIDTLYRLYSCIKYQSFAAWAHNYAASDEVLVVSPWRWRSPRVVAWTRNFAGLT